MPKPANLKLYGVDLPWVKTANHLGHELSEECSMMVDMQQKRADFIQKSTEIRETFSFAQPNQILQAVTTYCCSMYGSMTWPLFSEKARQVFNCWSTCVKLAWDVPRATHSYFLDYLSGGLVTVRRDVIARYAGFYKSLLTSPCREVNILARMVAKDIRTTTARNLSLLEKESGGLTWSTSAHKIREELASREPDVPRAYAWRIPYLGRLLEERDTLAYLGEEVERVQELVDSLCVN